MSDLKQLSCANLLALHARIGAELRDRGISRTGNNPAGDLAEHLFCRAFGWRQAGASFPSADATGEDGILYQIKARRLPTPKGSRQLGALRALDQGGFDYLAGVLFGPEYEIERAALIPHAVVLANSAYQRHTNSWLFHLRDAVWTWPGVVDATERLRTVSL